MKQEISITEKAYDILLTNVVGNIFQENFEELIEIELERGGSDEKILWKYFIANYDYAFLKVYFPELEYAEKVIIETMINGYLLTKWIPIKTMLEKKKKADQIGIKETIKIYRLPPTRILVETDTEKGKETLDNYHIQHGSYKPTDAEYNDYVTKTAHGWHFILWGSFPEFNSLTNYLETKGVEYEVFK